jgi:glyoxylase-like metal-dependent hydrolase (beta-lactamase superfamily II)
MRRLLGALGAFAAIALVAAVAGLGWAHLSIRRERPALPGPDAIAAALAADDLPVRLSIANTASQPMSRGGVLDAGRDPSPDAAYVMSHPSFVLEWADGRILLIDAGMTRDGAREFGRLIEWLGGGGPIEPHAPVAEQLGAARSRVEGAVFTHLHLDHVGGMAELCARDGGPVRVFLGEAQAERPNYTTRAGRRLLDEVGCARIEMLPGTGALALDGFPGVAVIPVGGHTPGSQIVVAHVADASGSRRYVFTGDAVNALDGIRAGVPKPFLYRLLIVPEDEERQRELRLFLADLADSGWAPLVSHDELALAQSGVPALPDTEARRGPAASSR